jgi:hypothetical protein
MAITIETPANLDQIEYFASFAQAFAGNIKMQAALLGVKDSLRQARLVPLEPLGMLACLTAEEEAATFLYYTLKDKGYSIPVQNQLRNHHDKVKLLILAQLLIQYFFETMSTALTGTIRVEQDGDRPKTTKCTRLGDYEIIQDDPLQTVVSTGDDETGHDIMVERIVDAVIAEITPKGFTIESHIKSIANRRNLCLYGGPSKKPRFQSEAEIEHFRFNCVAIIVLGFMVFNGETTTPSMEKLIETMFRKINAQQSKVAKSHRIKS